jgi:hypothetical protein
MEVAVTIRGDILEIEALVKAAQEPIDILLLPLEC